MMLISATSMAWQGEQLGAGSLFAIDELTGWEETPAGRVDDTARTNAHGSYDTSVWSEARTVAVVGHCWTVGGRDELVARFQRAANFSAGASDLTVTMAGRTLTSRARLLRAGATLTRGQWGVGRFGWQAQWRCPDPLRYGPIQSGSTRFPIQSGGLRFPLFTTLGVLDFGALGSSGQVTVDNPGTAYAAPSFRVDGPTPSEGFDLVEYNSGQRIRYGSAIPAGAWVDIDADTGRATINGQADRTGELVLAQWWTVAPGGSNTVGFVPWGTGDPAALLTASCKPAYW